MSWRDKKCIECSETFEPQQSNAEFCPVKTANWKGGEDTGKRCRQKFNNRRQQRGAKAYDLAMQWRTEKSQKALTKLKALLDAYAAEDTAAERKTYTDQLHDRYGREI